MSLKTCMADFLLQNTNIRQENSLIPIEFHFIFCPHNRSQWDLNLFGTPAFFKITSSVLLRRKNVIQGWHNMRASKIQFFMFKWTNPLNMGYTSRQIHIGQKVISYLLSYTSSVRLEHFCMIWRVQTDHILLKQSTSISILLSLEKE